MKRDHCVAPLVLATRKTHIAYDADESAPWYQCVETLLPDLVELSEELLVVTNEPELTVGAPILFERPVRRRCQDQMHAFML